MNAEAVIGTEGPESVVRECLKPTCAVEPLSPLDGWPPLACPAQVALKQAPITGQRVGAESMINSVNRLLLGPSATAVPIEQWPIQGEGDE